MESVREAELKLNDFEQKTNTLLMIDGQSFDLFMRNKLLEERFFKAAT
jgi:hypothetical protein